MCRIIVFVCVPMCEVGNKGCYRNGDIITVSHLLKFLRLVSSFRLQTAHTERVGCVFGFTSFLLIWTFRRINMQTHTQARGCFLHCPLRLDASHWHVHFWSSSPWQLFFACSGIRRLESPSIHHGDVTPPTPPPAPLQLIRAHKLQWQLIISCRKAERSARALGGPQGRHLHILSLNCSARCHQAEVQRQQLFPAAVGPRPALCVTLSFFLPVPFYWITKYCCLLFCCKIDFLIFYQVLLSYKIFQGFLSLMIKEVNDLKCQGSHNCSGPENIWLLVLE